MTLGWPNKQKTPPKVLIIKNPKNYQVKILNETTEPPEAKANRANKENSREIHS